MILDFWKYINKFLINFNLITYPAKSKRLTTTQTNKKKFIQLNGIGWESNDKN